ncbi:ATP-grasp domain-containing protein [bacterium]|nr:ATP-grasp domain-containing protein [bacterium]
MKKYLKCFSLNMNQNKNQKKNNRKNILVTCGGGSASIYFANKFKKKYNIFLVDASAQSIASQLDFPFSKVPFGNSPEFLKKIDELIKKWKIDCIVPGADEELLPISRYCQKKLYLKAVIPSYNFIELCLNKKQLMKKLKELKISNLPTFIGLQEIKYPAIVKPIYGRGSKEVHLVKNEIELEGYTKLYGKKISDLVIQKNIDGDEYTVSVIVNNLNKLIAVVPKKVILKKGITRTAVIQKNIAINKVCEKIVKLLNPNGPFNVQLKLFKDRIYIFEINPRLSTTSVLTDRAFGNEIELYLKYYDKTNILSLPKLKNNIFLYRYEENFFISNFNNNSKL